MDKYEKEACILKMPINVVAYLKDLMVYPRGGQLCDYKAEGVCLVDKHAQSLSSHHCLLSNIGIKSSSPARALLTADEFSVIAVIEWVILVVEEAHTLNYH